MPFITEECKASIEGIVTVGAISRAFPEHQGCLHTVLQNLKLIGDINYDEYASYPVKVRVGSMTRVQPKLAGYNNQSTFPVANPKTQPDPASLYGSEHARQF